MNVLLLGSGGREHAILRALRKSACVDRIHAAPGNAGMSAETPCHRVDPMNPDAVIELAYALKPDLVIIGPEGPLCLGVADALRNEGYVVFGPGRQGAMLEGSKSFAKAFMKRHGIPTADFDICVSLSDVSAALARRRPPFVIKADGLAAGKGVVIADTVQEAKDAASGMFAGSFGESGKTLLVEDFMAGDELTLLTVTDGTTLRTLVPSQDHKRVFDHDKGPNTGGMGAFAPVPWLDAGLMDRIRREILDPTVRGLQSERIPYRGALYFGLMITPEGAPKVVEYNVRFGDPETQAVLPLFEEDFARALLACAEGRLENAPWRNASQYAVDVVLTSGGYPGKYPTGIPITGIREAESMDHVSVLHAGTALKDGELVTSGGRILNVVATGNTLEEAIERAYRGVECISFDGAHFRRDIARKGRKGGMMS